MSMKWEDSARLGDLGTNWKSVLRETDPYDHTENFVCFTVNYQRTSLQIKVKEKNLQGRFFIINLYSIFLINSFDPDLQRKGQPSTMLHKVCF